MTETTTPQGSAAGEVLPVADEQDTELSDMADAFAELAKEQDTEAGAEGDQELQLDGRDDGEPADTSGQPAGDDGAAGVAPEKPAGEAGGKTETKAASEKPAAAPPDDERAQLEEKLRRATGQVAGLNKALAKTREELARTKDGGAGKAKTGAKLSEKDQQEYEALQRDYPDIVRLVELRHQMNSGEQPSAAAHKDVLDAVATLTESSAATAQSAFASAAAEAMRYVEGQRPGWTAAVQTDEFKRFVASRPGLRGLFESASIEDTIALYDIYAAQHPKAAVANTATAANPNRGATSQVAQRREQRVADSEGIAGRAQSLDLDADQGDLESAFTAAVRDLERQAQLHR